jgi:chloramphenicol 3-O phosphotransferase
MRTGRIVFLNGTSSSGKSSIARELLTVLDGDPYFHLAVDGVNAMRGKKAIAPDALDGVLRRTRRGFHRAAAGMAAAGNDLVVDHVLSEPWRLDDCLTVLDGIDVFLVGVHCPPAELERRERARGDRPAGLAAHQYALVHAHGVYDVECDTGAASPRECAELIKAHVESSVARGEPPTAFRRLRAARAAAGTRTRAARAQAGTRTADAAVPADSQTLADSGTPGARTRP